MNSTETQEGHGNWALSVEFLRAVLDGMTYDAVASSHGITRTAVERRVKAVAIRLVRDVGIDGLNRGSTAFVGRLRERRGDLLAALDRFDPASTAASHDAQILSADEVAHAVSRIRGRSAEPWRDAALFLILFVTGARPLEIARLRVADYLDHDGSVRRTSELPALASITGHARPLFFASSKLDEALGHYLRQRLERGQGVTGRSEHRGLDPESRLFLTSTGEGFRITQYGGVGQQRSLCRPILETYRKLFRYAELEGTTALSIRRTVVARLYERGADEEQVGLMLGISDRSSVRELFPRVRRELVSLVEDLV